MDHGRSYNAAVTSSIKANGLLCEHSTSVQCRVMTETWPGRKASGGRAKVILLSNPDCLGQSLIPRKMYLALPCPSYHAGREGVLCGVHTILRPDSKGSYKVTESRFGYRTLI